MSHTVSTDLGFKDLGLRPELLSALEAVGYVTPTPIQANAIPALLEGRDVLGQARTGTGKTAAFGLPFLHALDLERREVQAIVLTPTRELAMQVADTVRGYGQHLGKRGAQVLAVYGGQPMHIQLKALRRGVQVVIGTPGRVKDHLERGTLDLGKVRFFGLDEADEMLNMGFIEDVEWILERAPEEKQVALFSATMPKRIRAIADAYLSDPVDVTITSDTLTVPTIEQLNLRVHGLNDKDEAISRVLELQDEGAVLIFARTRGACSDLAERMQSAGLQAEAVHGGMTQLQREAVVRRLRAKATRIVVATDVAARGLDVEHIGLVINYDMPGDPEVYVHRIGRTGRAGREGRAITFYRSREWRDVQRIERHTGQRMERLHLPSQSELVTRSRGRMMAKLREVMDGELDPGFLALVQPLLEEGLDPAQVAAAALRLAWGDTPLHVAEEPRPERKKRERREREPRDRDAHERRPRSPRGDDADMVELVLPVGARNRLRPGDVVGAITGETGLSGQAVGAIRIMDTVTFVGVKAEHAEQVLSSLSGIRLRGRVIQPRRAHPQGERKGGRPESGHSRGPGGSKHKKPNHHRAAPRRTGPRQSSPRPRRDPSQTAPTPTPAP